ncbi:MAG: septal ring lytic transglycosylase RlpA family protein [Bacteroidaceae bacterium]|nr:septal ring lytic transglycosylase RlpA family protein [Bacteroidaceae bacterium]
MYQLHLRFLVIFMCVTFPILYCQGQVQKAVATAVEVDTTKWQLYEQGDATYYSARTHGRMMASGERYDRNGLFCAHKKLPFGTKIRVVSKKNDKEVIVVVKDRGPFAKGRVIDLSNKAAEVLGMLRDGVVPVELWIEKEGQGVN